jgi:hypothetical protein
MIKGYLAYTNPLDGAQSMLHHFKGHSQAG